MPFEDKRSFISKPKLIPGGCPNEIHLLLYGKDKASIRARVFSRNRIKYQGVNKCEQCGNLVSEFTDEFNHGGYWAQGDWHHISNKPGERCDCPENGQVLCKLCHRKGHIKPMFGKRSA